MWNEEDKIGFETESMKGRGQINIDSDLGKIIFDLAKMSENLTFIDIGTWNGFGSTKCFLQAMLENKQATLLTIENNTDKLKFAEKIWSSFIKENNLNVKFLNGSLVTNEQVVTWLLENNIELNDTENYWLEIDISNSKKLLELNIDNIDILLIDGSEFTGFLELLLLKDISKYILLDDVCSLKNKMSREYLLKSRDFRLITEDLNSRGGYSVFKKNEII